MILKGNQRAHGRNLALHLLNVEDNEHAVVHDLRGFVAADLLGAFKEVEAISLGTKCSQYLFSLSLNPPPDQNVPVDVFEEAIADIEQKLGLTGQPRAVVFHEKKVRRHAHVVWSRIDVESMCAINLPHFKSKLQEIARELYRTHGWDMPAGFENKEKRDRDSFDRVEAAQAKAAKRDPKGLKKLFREAWEHSDSTSSFAAALRSGYFELARGERRAFVAVDASGKIYSLSRWTGAGAKAIRARLGSVDGLPTIEEAQKRLQKQPGQQKQTTNERPPDLEEMIARHRAERDKLKTEQQAEALRSLKSRQRRMPRGLQATWAKITGRYQQIVSELAREAEQERMSHEAAFDALVAKHLAERRALQTMQEFKAAFSELEFDAGLKRDHRQHLILQQEDPSPSAMMVEFRPEVILDHLSEKHESFTEDEITRALRSIRSDPIWITKIEHRVRTSPELVQLSSDHTPRYTTRSFRQAQQSVFATAGQLAQDKGFGVDHRHVLNAIYATNEVLRNQGASLSQEQIAAIEHLADASALSCVVGLAGAGKSTILDAARQAWEAQGYTVCGAALAGKAADGLQAASGIGSRTLASLEKSWQFGYEPLPHYSVLVIDEVGMVGTRQLSRLMTELAKRRCKLVLVGDPEQLQPIEAGTPFRDILAVHDNAKLQEVRRQRTEWQREASSCLANGNVATALQHYAEHGCVFAARGKRDAIVRLADDYLGDNDKPGSQLALAHRRRDVFALNQAVRAGRLADGKLTGEHLIETDTGPRAFAVGDRILFTRNDTALGVRNGVLGTVTHIKGQSLEVDLDDTARTVDVDTKTFRSLDHGYAVSIHKSQGCTVDRTYVLGGKTMDRHLTYVAMTRHRDSARIYAEPAFSRANKLAHQCRAYVQHNFL